MGSATSDPRAVIRRKDGRGSSRRHRRGRQATIPLWFDQRFVAAIGRRCPAPERQIEVSSDASFPGPALRLARARDLYCLPRRAMGFGSQTRSTPIRVPSNSMTFTTDTAHAILDTPQTPLYGNGCAALSSIQPYNYRYSHLQSFKLFTCLQWSNAGRTF